LKQLGATELGAIEGKRSGEEIAVAGIVVAVRPMRSRKGDRWAIFTLQDMTGVLEILAFPEAFARVEAMLKGATPLLIKGRVNVEEAGTRIAMMEAQPLEDVAEPLPSLLRVHVDLGLLDEFTLDRLHELFRSKPGPCPVAFELRYPDGSIATLEAQQRVRPDRALVEAVCEMCGTDAVEVLR